MVLYSESSLSGWPAVLCGKNFNIGHYMQTVQPNFVIPVMLIGTIDFYYFISLSLTLTLPRGCNVSVKQNLFASFSPTLFIWSGWNLMWRCSSSSWTYWDCSWVRFIETREITTVYLTASKTLTLACIQMFYKSMWFKLGTMIDTILLCILILV